jgi:acetylornithine deacetylase/succinyl-diaminopimelate desuccinylase-like protein
MSIPNASPFETEFAQRIQISTANALQRDDIQWVPSLSTGFTDSRFTRNLGTTTYGMQGSHPDDDPMIAFIHGTNESVGIQSLISGTRIMLALAYDLLAVK